MKKAENNLSCYSQMHSLVNQVSPLALNGLCYILTYFITFYSDAGMLNQGKEM